MTFTYLALLYVITGVFQSGGWPSNVAVMGVWFGKGTRGLVMGIWNAHTSVGNILGTTFATMAFTRSHYNYLQLDMTVKLDNSTLMPHLAGEYTEKDAGLACDGDKHCVAFTSTEFDSNANASQKFPFNFINDTSKVDTPDDGSTDGAGFLLSAAETAGKCVVGSMCTFQKDVPYDLSYYVCGAIIAGGGLIVLLFLVPHPRDVGLPSPDEEDRKAIATADPESSLNESLLTPGGSDEGGTVSPIQALCIPGVVEFALAFFFAKFVAYFFLYWFPFYLESLGFSKTSAAGHANAFDVGGIIGGIICGLISDKLNMRAVVAAGSIFFAIPAMYALRVIVTGPETSDVTVSMLAAVSNLFINGVYALITTAVSADLGTSPELKGNANALAVVTAIIDGTGSAGSSLTGVATPWMKKTFATDSDPDGWNGIFGVLYLFSALSIVCLSRLIFKELKGACCAPAGPSTNLQYGGR